MATKTFTFSTPNHTYAIPIKHTKLSTVSSIIRAMAKDGLSTAKISRTTGIRYQHVRNVLTVPLKS